jgi:PST family polysaccharide transporter
MTSSTDGRQEAEGVAPASSGPGVDRGDMDRAFVHGIAWTGTIKWISQLFSWATTVLVARLLSPDDYGILGVAAILLILLGTLAEFGMGTAIVLRSDLDADAHAQLHTTSTLIGCAFSLACLPLAFPMAAFFRVADLRLAFPVIGLGFAISGLRTVPWALLQKRLQFRDLAMIEAGQTLTASVLAVAMAATGFGFWALVIPNLAAALVAAVWGLLLAPVRFAKPSLRTVGRVGGTSGHVLLQRLVWFASFSADTTVIGRRLGQEALGLYTLSSTIASTGSAKANELVARVTTGVYAAVQTSTAGLRRYLLATIEVMALLVFPAGVFLALTADWVAGAVFGEQWTPMVPSLRILALAALVRCLAPSVVQALMASGEQRMVSATIVFQAFTLLPAFWMATRWGNEGVAMIWLCVYPLTTIPFMARAVWVLQISARDLGHALGPAIGLTVAGAIVLVGCRWLAVELGVSRSAATPAALVLAAATYGGLGFVALRARLESMLGRLRRR